MVTPVETVKTKLIHMNMDFVRGVKHIVATEGLGGVYQGLGATILKQVRAVCMSCVGGWMGLGVGFLGATILKQVRGALCQDGWGWVGLG